MKQKYTQRKYKEGFAGLMNYQNANRYVRLDISDDKL